MDFEAGYFTERSNYSRAWLKGNKPLHYWRWRRYLRARGASGRLLDYGCGEGHFLRSLQRDFQAYGVDVSRYAVAQARQRAPLAQVQVLEEGPLLPFEPDSFDVVTALDVLEHLPQPALAVRELHRITRTGGLLMMTTPNLASLGRRWKGSRWHGYRDATHCSLWPQERWVAILEGAGYHIIDVFFDGLWDSPYWPRVPAPIQHLLFKVPATLLYGVGFRFPQRLGENLVLVARKGAAW